MHVFTLQCRIYSTLYLHIIKLHALFNFILTDIAAFQDLSAYLSEQDVTVTNRSNDKCKKVLSEHLRQQEVYIIVFQHKPFRE